MAKLTESDRNTMRDMRRTGARLKAIAKTFRCSVPHVSAILSGRSCIGDKPTPPKPAFRGPNVMPGITMKQLTARR